MFRGGAHAITSSHTSWYSTIYPSSIDLLTFFFLHCVVLFSFICCIYLHFRWFCFYLIFLRRLCFCDRFDRLQIDLRQLTTCFFNNKKSQLYNKRVFHGIATRAFSAPKKHDLYCIQNDCTRCTGSVEILLDLFLWFNWEKQKFNQE